MDELLTAVDVALRATALSDAMRQWRWLWPICESLHFLGLALLMGTVGLFDLRLMGLAPRVPVAALHRLIPVGIAGFVLNVVTGACFVAGTPEQYLFNAAFRVKVALMLIAGLNVAVFYRRVFEHLLALPPGAPLPAGARLAGAVSLTAWIGVMTAGRLLTFFRPPF